MYLYKYFSLSVRKFAIQISSNIRPHFGPISVNDRPSKKRFLPLLLSKRIPCIT